MSASATHVVSIQAKDGLTQQFRVMGQSALSSAQQITGAFRNVNTGLAQADATAIKAAADIDRLGNEMAEAGVKGAGGITKASTALSDFNAKNAAAGAAVGTLVGLLSDATRAAAEEAAGLDRLEQAVTNTGASYDQYATAIDAAVVSSQQLAFADDQAVDALNILTAATQDTEQALQLLGTAQDLARGKGISLATASEVIGKVAAGNLGILSRYGIVLDENATSTEALAAIQQRFAGQSVTFAESQAGAAARMRNEFDNLVESIGANTGELQSLLLILPGATSGFQLLSGAVGGLTKLNAGSFRALTQGVLGLVGAINPLTIGAGLAIAGIANLTKEVLDFRAAASEAADPTDSLTDAILRLSDASAGAEVNFLVSTLTEGWKGVSETANQATKDIIAAQEAAAGQAGLGGVAVDEFTAYTNAIALNSEELEKNREEAERAAISKQGLRDIEGDIATILAQSGDELVKDIRLTNEAIEAYRRREYTGAQLVEVINNIATVDQSAADALSNIASSADIAAPIMDDLNRSVTAAYGAINQGVDTEALRQFKADADAAREAADAFFASQRAIAASQSNDPAAGSLSFPTPGQSSKNAIDLKAASEARAAERTEEHTQALEENAQALEEQRNAALSAADALIGSQDDVTQAAEDAAQAQADAAREVGEIERQRIQETSALNRQYAQEVKAASRDRVTAERDAAKEIRELELERREIATETEEQLRELAQQRGDVQLELTQSVADAEQEWLQTSRENVQQQAQLKSELARTTAEAASEWRALNAENLAAQREIKEELRDTLAEQNTDIKRTRQDIERDRQRSKEDLAIALSDPTLTPEQRFQIELDFERKMEDLRLQERRAEQDHKREQKEAREAAREEEQALEEERKAAAQAYHTEVQGLEAETNQRIRELEQERLSAAQAFADQRRDAEADAASRLTEIAAQEKAVLDEQAAQFAQIERDKELAARNAARVRQGLEREVASEAEKHAREVGQVQRNADREVADVRAELAAQEIDDRTKLQELVDKGLLTQGQANQIYDAAVKTQTTFKDLEDEKLAIAGLQLLKQGDLLAGDKERITLAEELNRVAEPTDPLDGTPRAKGASAAPEVKVSVDAEDISKTIDDELSKVADREVVIPILAQTRHQGAGMATAPAGTNEPIKNALDGVILVLDGLDKREVTVDVTADTDGFWSAVRAITSRESVGSTKILVSADTANADVAGATQKVGTLAASTFTAELGLDVIPFLTALNNAQASGDKFADLLFTATLAADMGSGKEPHAGSSVGKVLSVVESAKIVLGQYANPETPWVATLGADASSVQETIDGVVKQVSEISDIETEIAIKADLSAFWRAIRDIDGDTVGTARIAVFADVEDEGASASSQGRSATFAQGAGAFGVSAFGGAPTALGTRIDNSIRAYGPIHVHPPSDDVHSAVRRSISTRDR